MFSRASRGKSLARSLCASSQEPITLSLLLTRSPVFSLRYLETGNGGNMYTTKYQPANQGSFGELIHSSIYIAQTV